jgi:hypothetical protein
LGESTLTAQIPNWVTYKGEKYSLIGLRGDWLPAPQDFGITPSVPHTACYRGYIAGFELNESGFFLQELTVWRSCQGADVRFPPINSVLPRTGYADESGRKTPDNQAAYSGLCVPVPFTGTLRLASGFVEDFYIHQGFQKASAFETVLDVTLVEGRCVKIEDRSEEAAQRRGEFKKRYMKDGDVVGAVQEAFDLDLDLW